MNFGFVPPPFGALWPDVRKLLGKAVQRGGNNWSDVRQKLEDGRAQLWMTVAGKPINAAVTKMDGNTLEIWLCGGRVIPDAVHLLEVALNAAEEGGATNARIIGRKGWERVLRPYGWRREGEMLVKRWNDDGQI